MQTTSLFIITNSAQHSIASVSVLSIIVEFLRQSHCVPEGPGTEMYLDMIVVC